MRNFLLVFLFLIFSSSVIAQTSIEEYKYVSKGYRMETEGGLDAKRGYYFKDLESFDIEYPNWIRTTGFKTLYRERGHEPAAIMMIFERSDTEYQAYFCIPLYNSSEEVWDMAYEDFVIQLTLEWGIRGNSRDYAWGMVNMISYLFSNELH